MKLVVQGIEEIELTDPQGLCNPPAPSYTQALTPRQPQALTPQIPPPMPACPPLPLPWEMGKVAVPHRLLPRTRTIDDKAKWGIGGPMIQQTGDDPKDADKWGKNWQRNGEGHGNENNG